MPIVHAIFAYALSYFSGAYAFFAITGAILPDVDTLFTPYREIHRAFLHTPIAGIALTVVLYYLIRNKKIAASFLMGWVSHLFLDTLTVTGIMWKYPFSTDYFTTASFRSIDIIPNFAVISFSILSIMAAILFSRKRMKALKRYIHSAEAKSEGGFAVLALAFLMVASGMLLASERDGFPKIEDSVLISKLLQQQGRYDGKYVTIAGYAKGVDNYTSRGVGYQVLLVDDGSGSIRVYKSGLVPPSPINAGDEIIASGLFSTDRRIPELRITPSIGLVKIQSR